MCGVVAMTTAESEDGEWSNLHLEYLQEPFAAQFLHCGFLAGSEGLALAIWSGG